MEIGKIIKEQRTSKNMTQEELANEFFVSRPLISKWENGKSYPDLEQLLKLSDFFDLTLDELMRGDKKMTNKLNFDIKKKRVLIFLVGFLTIITINYFISTFYFEAPPNSLKTSKIEIIQDKSYNGGVIHRDWNAVVFANVTSKNIFFKPKPNSFLVSANKNNLSGNIQWSFSLFNIFNSDSPVTVKQTVLIDTSVSEINFDINNSDKTIPVKIK